MLRFFLALSTFLAIRPLSKSLYPGDQITDIPLTPSQRSLLGLDPSPLSGSPATAGGAEGYVTPPRYRRYSGSFSSLSGGGGSGSWSSPLVGTPATDRRSISATYYSSSPLSGAGAGAGAGAFTPSNALSPFRSPSRSGSPFSPSPSPLLHRAFAGKNNSNNNSRERDLLLQDGLGSSAASLGLGRSQSVGGKGLRVGIDSPTPGGVSGDGIVRRSPGVNYKWLYDKGVRLPRSETMQL